MDLDVGSLHGYLRSTKPFADLSHEELIALSDNAIERYIDIACAEAGVRLLPDRAPTPPPAGESISGDLSLHEVAGLLFADRVTADIVARAINSAPTRYHEETDYTSRQYRKHASPADTPVEVKAYTAFSREKHEASKLAAMKHEAATAAYQEIWDKVNAARALELRRGQIRRQYEHYMELADCNVTVARRFLTKAYPDAEQLYPDAFRDDLPPPAPRAIRVRDAQPVPAPSNPDDSGIPF